jgi:hypothetical protein
VILDWVWGERQHGVGIHLWLRRHEVPRTMNGTGYSGQVPVKVYMGFTLGVLGPLVLARRNNGLYLTQALYHHFNSIEMAFPSYQPEGVAIHCDTDQALFRWPRCSQAILTDSTAQTAACSRKRASRLEILLGSIGYLHARS